MLERIESEHGALAAPSADANDHRSLAQRLDLLHFQEEAPGMVFWHPRGYALYRVLEEAVRRHGRDEGYAEIRTPQILRKAAWEASGHWSHFRDGMFRVEDQACEAAIKPVSCPGHIYVVQSRLLSYRDLPLRLSELGVVHRDEPSGTLHGLLRLRQFTQDDGHIFCAEEQAAEEVARFCRAVPRFYRAFGFESLRVAFSTRPNDRAGDEASWDRAESALEQAVRDWGVPYVHQPGAGAFYGPKLEFVLQDRLGRQWQWGTIQFDLVMPARFDLKYVDAGGQRKHPVMLHRALFGSLERFLGILLEHHGGALPAWLAPTQVLVLPIGADQSGTARELCDELRRAGVRAEVREEESLSRRIAEAHRDGTPLLAVIGKRERENGRVTVRARDGQSEMPIEVAVRELAERCKPPRLDE